LREIHWPGSVGEGPIQLSLSASPSHSPLVIFTSDNGPLPTFGGRRAGHLRGSKLSLYEGGIREPFIIRWPGHVPAGQTDATTLLSAVDLFPSLCDIAGAAVPKDARFDGEDLSAALLGKPTPRANPLFWEYGRNNKSFAYPRGPARSPNLAIRDGQWKLLVNDSGEGAELYDLLADPKETTNVASAQPEILNRLRERLIAWRRTMP
jgi:arylsulfatase A-like enzyme